MLSKRPLDEDFMVQCAREWLERYPQDTFALRFLGIHLAGRGDHQEALKAFEASYRSFPFYFRWLNHAESLVRLKKDQEAQQLLALSVAYNTEQPEAEAKLRYYTVLKEINTEKAVQLLDQYGAMYPDHEGLLAARVDLEDSSKRYLDALELARDLVRRAPKPQHQVRLLKALHYAHRDEEARKTYRALAATLEERSSEFYDSAREVLEREGNQADLEALWKRFAQEYPDSVLLAERRADALAAAGKLTEAEEQYRLLLKIAKPSDQQLRKYAAILRRSGGLPAQLAEMERIVRLYSWSYRPQLLASSSAAPHQPPAAPAAPGNAPAHLVAQVGHGAGVTALSLSADGSFLASASEGSVLIWRVDNAQELRRLQQNGEVWSVAFAPDGTTLATGGNDGAIRLWSLSGNLFRSFDHAAPITALAFTPDGTIVAGSSDGQVTLWDSAGKRLASLSEPSAAGVTALALSPDGSLAATSSSNGPVRLWDLRNRKRLATLYGHLDASTALAFLPDGRFLATGGQDGTVRLWHLASGADLGNVAMPDKVKCLTVLHGVKGMTLAVGTADGGMQIVDLEAMKLTATPLRLGHEIRSLAQLGDGGELLVAPDDGTIRVVDPASGKERRSFQGTAATRPPFSFTPDGRYLLSGGEFGAVHLWGLGAKYGEQVVRLTQKGPAFGRGTPDGRQVVVTGASGEIALWDLETQKLAASLPATAGSLSDAMVSPDGKTLATLYREGTARLWNLAGTLNATVKRVLDWGQPVAFLDARRVAVGSEDSNLYLLDAASGLELSRLTGHSAGISAVAVSADGRLIASGSLDRSVLVWDTATGKKLSQIGPHEGAVVALAFAPGSGLVASASPGSPIRLWDPATGAQKLSFGTDSLDSDTLAFSPDGRFLLTGSTLSGIRLWDCATGRQIAHYPMREVPLLRQDCFHPSGEFAVIPGDQGVAQLVRTSTGTVLARLLSFADGSWAVLDSKGRYDASNGGEINGLHWVVGNETIDLSQLKERYYEPGLLSKVLGLNSDALRPVDALQQVRLSPQVRVTIPKDGSGLASISLKNRGGGIGKVRILVNGKEVAADARGAKADPASPSIEIPLEIPEALLLPGEENSIQVVAWNEEGYLSSRGTPVSFRPAKRPASAEVSLHAIVVGISQYAGPGMNLAFSGKDASDMADAIRVSSRRLFGVDRVQVTLLTDYPQARDAALPTREAIAQAFKAAAKSLKAGDILVVYLSGHGVMAGSGDGADYYYLAREARSTDLSDPSVRSQYGISSTELTEWIKQIPALKQVMVLDTCAAGGIVTKLVEKRDLPSSQVRALDRLKDRTGFHVLMGAAADRVSLEASRYGQGLLTWSLLEGMRGAALREGEYVDVQKLFQHAEDKVPELARSIGGIQKPIKASPAGNSFDFGRVLSEDKGRIPLASDRPMVLRATFLSARPPVADTLRLSQSVNAELREQGAAARGSGIVYVDAEELPGAYFLSGSYQKNGGAVTVQVYLTEGENQKASFTVSGSAESLPTLAREIVRRTEEVLK